MSIIAIMIPVAISIGDPAAALILLAGVYYGAIFGGSTSSILINAPALHQQLQRVLMDIRSHELVRLVKHLRLQQLLLLLEVP